MFRTGPQSGDYCDERYESEERRLEHPESRASCDRELRKLGIVAVISQGVGRPGRQNDKSFVKSGTKLDAEYDDEKPDEQFCEREFVVHKLPATVVTGSV